MPEEKEIPKIEIKGDVLTISISADDLAFITEGRSEDGYVVKDKLLFLQDFKKQLDGEWQSSNAQEIGITELQYFIDNCVDEVYCNASESIDKKEEYK